MAPLLVLFSADCVGKLSATSLPTPTFWPWFPPAPRWRSEHPQQLWPPDLFPLVFQTPGRGHAAAFVPVVGGGVVGGAVGGAVSTVLLELF